MTDPNAFDRLRQWSEMVERCKLDVDTFSVNEAEAMARDVRALLRAVEIAEYMLPRFGDLMEPARRKDFEAALGAAKGTR
jgi:hypothetical protein